MLPNNYSAIEQKSKFFYNFVRALTLTSNEQKVILVVVVVYKDPKEDRSVTEGMMCRDVDVISRAQIAMGSSI